MISDKGNNCDGLDLITKMKYWNCVLCIIFCMPIVQKKHLGLIQYNISKAYNMKFIIHYDAYASINVRFCLYF